jgi:uncharacterized membrane protein YccC
VTDSTASYSAGHRLLAFLAGSRTPRARVAAFRALRATLVIPGLFALTSHVIDNSQISLFATFGGFATLVLASFSGTRWQKLAAHIALGVVGSAFVSLATVTSDSAAAASLVALPVVFCVIYAGVTGWNAANGSAAALLAYILPATSPGAAGMIPPRLAGWWLATAVGTLAVLLLSPRSGPSPLRRAAADASGILATELEGALHGTVDPGRVERVDAASRALAAAFTAAPYRPTGLAIADQAVARLVESLQWCASLVTDLLRDGVDLAPASQAVTERDRRRLEVSVRALLQVSQALGDRPVATISVTQLEALLQPEAGAPAEGGAGSADGTVDVAFHVRILANAIREAVTNALVATGVRIETGAAQARNGVPAIVWARAAAARGRARMAAALHDLRGQLSIRSVWVRNGARGAVAIAAAVAVADLTDVQHGFWVVLGTLGVLRTSAASTGANAWWALVGTVAGVLIGAGLVLGIGVGSATLWAALVVAVLFAAYAPGVLPFPIGQAAFTVLLVVLYNLIAPVGWKVGVYRVEDIGIGVGVSALVGVLFWPRGAAAAVADDVADVLHRGGIYLVQATSWALGARSAPPEGTHVLRASERLDDATRSLLAEQSAKRTPKEDIWRLVGGAMKLRLTAASLAAATPVESIPLDNVRYELLQESLQVAGQCDALAAELGHVDETVVLELAGLVPAPEGLERSPARLVWIREHIEHARAVVLSMAEPASAVASVRHTPWWR